MALAGVIMPGVAKFIVMLSAQAEVFGVGITVMVGSMLVPPSPVITGWIVPGAVLPGSSGVESGKAAPLVGGPPGVELHTVVDELPSGDTADIVPVMLPTIDGEMVPKGAVGVIAIADIVVVDGVGAGGAVVTSEGGAQVTTVPGVVGSEASGTGASVVSGTPGWVAAENGLGPLSGEDSIAPGVDERPIAVVPMVET